MIKKINITFVLLISGMISFAQTSTTAKLDQLFDRLSEKNKAMGSMLIVQDGKTAYERSIGYGSLNATEKQPLANDTRYRIGSVTKMFTATMIFQLVEEGKLKLTDALSNFLPQFPNAEKITIQQILGHKSGIHEVTSDGTFRTRRFEGVTKDEMLATIAKAPLDFEPGAKYAYSSAGYFILGTIIEKLTGKSYDEALKERITSKIGLKHTYIGGKIEPKQQESFSYKLGKDWEQQPETHPSLLFGSGGMVSTTQDMAKFIQALFELKLVSKASLDQMTKEELGMDTFTYFGKTGYGHTGGIDGFGSWLVYLPEEKMVLSYATNGKVYPVKQLIDDVFTIYWNKPFTLPTFETLAISKELLDQYVGVYSLTGAPAKFTISRDGTTLYAQPPGQNAIPLEPTGQNTFKIDPPGITFEFDIEKKQMTLKRNGGERVFTKEN